MRVHRHQASAGDDAYAIGMGTHIDWDGPMEIKDARPSIANGYEGVCNETRIASFFLSSRYTRWTDHEPAYPAPGARDWRRLQARGRACEPLFSGSFAAAIR